MKPIKTRVAVIAYDKNDFDKYVRTQKRTDAIYDFISDLDSSNSKVFDSYFLTAKASKNINYSELFNSIEFADRIIVRNLSSEGARRYFNLQERYRNEEISAEDFNDSIRAVKNLYERNKTVELLEQIEAEKSKITKQVNESLLALNSLVPNGSVNFHIDSHYETNEKNSTVKYLGSKISVTITT